MTVQGRQRLITWSAASAGPILWAVSTQVGLILPYRDCSDGHHWTAIAVWGSCGLVLLAALICWRNRPPGRPRRFAAGVAALLALVFAFAMALQAVAGTMLSGCER